MNEDEVREVVANYRANHMPLDAVVLDIDYMEHYKDFTVDAPVSYTHLDVYKRQIFSEHPAWKATFEERLRVLRNAM